MRSVATRTIRPEGERLPAISAESIPRTGGEWRPPSETCVYRCSAYRVIMVPNGRDRAQNGPPTVGEGGRADIGSAAVAAHCPAVDLRDGGARRAGKPGGGAGAATAGEAEDGEAGAGRGAATSGAGQAPERRGSRGGGVPGAGRRAEGDRRYRRTAEGGRPGAPGLRRGADATVRGLRRGRRRGGRGGRGGG